MTATAAKHTHHLLLFLMLHRATSLTISRSNATIRALRGPRFHSITQVRFGYPHKSPALYLNRILFDASEIDNDNRISSSGADDESPWMATVTLPKSDYRTIHIAKILGLKSGDVVRAGSVIHCNDDDDTNDDDVTSNNSSRHLQGLLTDEATVQWLPEGKIKKDEPTKNGDPPGSVRLCIPHPPKTTTITTASSSSSNNNNQLPVALLLAVPRPLQLQRILPMISQCGVSTLILTHAAKVPKDYFGSHLFRKPHLMRDLLIEGLTLSGMDLQLPKVIVSKRPLKELLLDNNGVVLGGMFPEDEWVRVIAHPERSSRIDGDEDRVVRMTDLEFPMEKLGKRRQILIAVGPEGGWEEPNELDLFEQNGFQKVTLGSRVLRSDVAVVSLLALANEVCSKISGDACSNNKEND